jgi:hypothetical protein
MREIERQGGPDAPSSIQERIPDEEPGLTDEQLVLL